MEMFPAARHELSSAIQRERPRTCKQCKAAALRLSRQANKDAFNAQQRARRAVAKNDPVAVQRESESRRKRASKRTAEQRQEERRRALERAGKVYRTRQEIEQERTKVRQQREAEKQARAEMGGKRPSVRSHWPNEASHSAHVRAWKRADSSAWFRHQYATDPAFVLHQRMRARMRKQAKQFAFVASYFGAAARRAQGGNRIWALVGYGPQQLRQHIEAQFTGRMSWDRLMAGEIHIDHIVPVSAFALDSEQSVRECWSLSNLRPLWASDNLRKGAKRTALL